MTAADRDQARFLWEGLLKLLLLLYLVAHVSTQLPAIVDPLASRSGMVNWLGKQRPLDEAARFEPHEGGTSDSAELRYFKRATGLRRSAPGYAALLALTRAIGQPVMLAKAYPWLLVAITLAYVFALVRRLAGAEAGFFAGVLFLHLPGLQELTVGLPIAFAWPLLAATAYHLHRDQPRAVLACVGLAGLFYPPMALVGGVLLAVRRVRRDPTSGRLQLPWRDRTMWGLAGLMVAIAVAVAPWQMLRDSGDLLSMVSYEGRYARDAAAARGLGLSPPSIAVEGHMLPQESFLEIAAAEIAETLGQPLQVSGVFALPLEPPLRWTFRLAPAALALALLLAVAVLGRRALPPRIAVELLAVGGGLYLLATLLAFRLFVPQRYVAFALPLAALIYLAVLTGRATADLPVWPRRFTALGLVAAYLLGFGSGLSRVEEWVEDHGDAAGLLAYLTDETDAGALIAGPPPLMDAVELFADRDTFAFCQEILSTADALDGPVYADLVRRVDALWRAYYASDAVAVAGFMDHHAVDYLVVEHRFLDAGHAPAENLCGVPAATLREVRDRARPPYLDAPAATAIVYEDDHFTVIERRRLASSIH